MPVFFDEDIETSSSTAWITVVAVVVSFRCCCFDFHCCYPCFLRKSYS